MLAICYNLLIFAYIKFCSNKFSSCAFLSLVYKIIKRKFLVNIKSNRLKNWYVYINCQKSSIIYTKNNLDIFLNKIISILRYILVIEKTCLLISFYNLFW